MKKNPNRLTFGLGTVGRDMVYTMISMYLMFYLTDVLQLPDDTLWWVTGIMLVARVFDALNDPFINDDYAREMGAATEEECASIKQMALLINETLKEFFMTANLRLIDFKIEFGRLASDPSQIVLADEISPDTCRLWDVATGKKMDKDRFRQGLGGFMEAYADVLDRLQK